MFNYWKKPIVKPKNTAETVTEPVKTIVTPLPPQDVTAYQIGKTESGKTTLRVGDHHTYSMLTMNDEGVRTLMRMLLASIEPELAKVPKKTHDGRGPG